MIYVINVDDPGLQSMVLSSPVPDLRTFFALQWDPEAGIYSDYPPYDCYRIHALMQECAFESNEFQALENSMLQYVTRTFPLPDCVLDCFDGANQEIVEAMVGPADVFAVSNDSSLYELNVTEQLKAINRPVLLTHGKYDSVRKPTIDMMLRELPQSRAIYLSQSLHFSMIDQPKVMNDAVATFFEQVEGPCQHTGSLYEDNSSSSQLLL